MTIGRIEQARLGGAQASGERALVRDDRLLLAFGAHRTERDQRARSRCAGIALRGEPVRERVERAETEDRVAFRHGRHEPVQIAVQPFDPAGFRAVRRRLSAQRDDTLAARDEFWQQEFADGTRRAQYEIDHVRGSRKHEHSRFAGPCRIACTIRSHRAAPTAASAHQILKTEVADSAVR